MREGGREGREGKKKEGREGKREEGREEVMNGLMVTKDYG